MASAPAVTIAGRSAVAPETRQVAVIEVFRSVQGEGRHTGLPTIFVRLAGCNVRCSWCDTTYSFKTDRDHVFTYAQLLDQVHAWLPIRRVCLTGGEPLAQRAAAEWLMAQLSGYDISVETNGTLPIRADHPWGETYVLDYKLPGSGVARRFDERNWEALRAGDQMKFVIADRADYEAACSLLTRIPAGVERLFSPVFGKLEARALVEWILEDGLDVRLQLQVHKFIWEPSRRGV